MIQSPTRFSKFVFSALALTALSVTAMAQDASLDTKVNDALRGGNKYYTVVAVLVTIFTVLFTYLVYQDIKLNRLKKDLNSKLPNTNEQNRDA
jgi:hypothetical protein